ncbi:MAG: hypothetical protein N2Z21_04775 [Candidatus Sumerlaeaceae bacterium]|nr:hypothetical protein [Candidatus Sumerlaeaceae bacterium]
MAKKKRDRETTQSVDRVGAAAGSPSKPTPEPEGQSAAGRQMPLSFREYLMLNLVFDVFCVVQLILARLFIRETRGMYFFFGILIIGFFLVSMFDYLYERMQTRSQQPQRAGS